MLPDRISFTGMMIEKKLLGNAWMSYSTVQPMLDYYEDLGNLVIVNADRSVEEVFTELKKFIVILFSF